MLTTGKVANVKTLGERARYARLRLGLNQIDIDKRLGKKPGYLTRIESGERLSPRVDSMKALAAALEVDMLWLVSGEGPAPRPVGTLQAEPDCLSLVPRGTNFDRMLPSLRVVLERDMIPTKYRDQIPALVAMKFKDGHLMTEEAFVAMAERLHNLTENPPPAPTEPEHDPVEEKRRQNAAKAAKRRR